MQTRTSRFTLIELLGVLCIMGIMLGIALAAFSHFGAAGKVDSGARMISRALHLARVQAIATRRRVAVLLPGAEAPAAVRGTLAWAYVSNLSHAEGLVDGTKVEHLPAGVRATAITLAPPVTDGDAYQEVEIAWETLHRDLIGTGVCRAFVFRANGSIVDQETRRITVTRVAADGAPIAGATVYHLDVAGFTGRATFVK